MADFYTLAEKTIVEKGGIASNADFHANGLRNYQITILCNQGFLELIRRGHYQLASFQEAEYFTN